MTISFRNFNNGNIHPTKKRLTFSLLNSNDKLRLLKDAYEYDAGHQFRLSESDDYLKKINIGHGLTEVVLVDEDDNTIMFSGSYSMISSLFEQETTIEEIKEEPKPQIIERIENVVPIEGPEGPRGADGSSGMHGMPGDKGDIGEKGDKGDFGEKGDKGDIGEKGDKGDIGKDGKPGPRGERGNKGDIGNQGPGGLVEAQFPLKYDKNKKKITLDTKTLNKILSVPTGQHGPDWPAMNDWLAAAGGAVGVRYKDNPLITSVEDINFTGSGVNVTRYGNNRDIKIDIDGSNFSYGDDAPADPSFGDRWYEIDTGVLYTFVPCDLETPVKEDGMWVEL